MYDTCADCNLTGAVIGVRQIVQLRVSLMRENGGMKLLLVEDDRKVALAVKRGLEAEDFAVEVSQDGDEGFWLATEGSYDLIILDIMLPGRNGYRVCDDLRNVNTA